MTGVGPELADVGVHLEPLALMEMRALENTGAQDGALSKNLHTRGAACGHLAARDGVGAMGKGKVHSAAHVLCAAG